MSKYKVTPVDQELKFSSDEIIVTKTDLTGKLLYANDVFCRLAEMSTEEVIGQPHSVIRHPDMPRAVFQLLWDTISKGKEIFAYVKNMSATGKYYWVVAHVTPTRDRAGNIIGYHSNRRAPSRAGIADIMPLYRELLAEEAKGGDRKAALAASTGLLKAKLDAIGKTYDEFIWSTGEANV
ncbi:PAS domain-containing protein [Kordiimonas sp.]|uniref:PAS domain-containing protein n=1 Tax=Kordiimonas sp. TaxID=1970157 RepID=UPI003A914894